MKLCFKIHRGTNEIGGSCVEVWTENTRILLDFGMPLVEKDGKEFNYNKYKRYGAKRLIELGVLPDINGLYENVDALVDGVVISHPHQDHFGLIDYVDNNVQYYLGEATHKLIELNNLFTSQDIHLKNTYYFEREKTFKIGDISVTPYWADHSAFDAYSFLIEFNNKSLFYSGDFRSHGRKAKAFYWFTHNAPKNVDYLLLEGTTIGRNNKPFKIEQEIENELVETFKQKGKINLIYTSGQNIDRLTSIYKACKRTGKIFVIDVYVAKILMELSKFAGIPHPSEDFPDIRVMFPIYTSRRLKNEGNEKILYQFKRYKITKDEISDQSDKIVMVARPSMKKDLEKINKIDGGNLIYSMWEGYLKKSYTKDFIDYLTKRRFRLFNIHTSGHADIKTLKTMIDTIDPKYVIPIHTFEKGKYKTIFNKKILEVNDGEVISI